MNSSGGMASTASRENIQLMAASRVTSSSSRSALWAWLTGTEQDSHGKRAGDGSTGPDSGNDCSGDIYQVKVDTDYPEPGSIHGADVDAGGLLQGRSE